VGVSESRGVRERKKRATREALSAAALRLAREHGPENVRVDDIAEAAGVSPRTYNNYFSSREQAIMVALAAERGQRVGAALRARPAEEPLDQAVVAAVIEQYSGDGEPARDTLALITSAPALQAEFLDTIAAIEGPLAEAIAARTGTGTGAGTGTGTGPDAGTGTVGAGDAGDGRTGRGQLGAEVLAAAVSAAARVAAERWLRPEPETPFSVVLLDALTWVAPALRRRPREGGTHTSDAGHEF
jgi:AcrR family transcriptional regulator